MVSSFSSSAAATPAKIRVILVDDHNRFRVALRQMLETDAEIEVVGEASDGPEAMQLVDQTTPDIVCMDIRLLIFDGVEATRRLHQSHPEVKVIGISGQAEQSFINAMFDAGAVAYVSKANVSNDLLPTIHRMR